MTKEVTEMNANIFEFQKFMQLNNYTQSSLAKELGLSRGSINRVLNGQRSPGGQFMSAFKRRFPDKRLDNFFYA